MRLKRTPSSVPSATARGGPLLAALLACASVASHAGGAQRDMPVVEVRCEDIFSLVANARPLADADMPSLMGLWRLAARADILTIFHNSSFLTQGQDSDKPLECRNAESARALYWPDGSPETFTIERIGGPRGDMYVKASGGERQEFRGGRTRFRPGFYEARCGIAENGDLACFSRGEHQYRLACDDRQNCWSEHRYRGILELYRRP